MRMSLIKCMIIGKQLLVMNLDMLWAYPIRMGI